MGVALTVCSAHGPAVNADIAPILIVAVAVWLPWRVVRWKRRPGDPLREASVAALFAWALVVVGFTLSPLRGILNDWGSSMNLVPFASITDMLRYSIPSIARRNIAGNLLLLAPIGVLLPLLFTRVRRPLALVWRAAAISLTIEFIQFISRSRTVDIDDVILNVVGAAAGFALFAAFAWVARRSASGRTFLSRMGSTTDREPLLLAAFPVGVTALVSVPVMIAIVFAGTLGTQGIERDVTAAWPGSSVVARAETRKDAFLVASETLPEGERLRCNQYRRVFPGRYTQMVGSEIPAGNGSRYSWMLTSTNAREAEIPTVVVWGANRAGATTLQVEGIDVSRHFNLPPGDFFAVTFDYDVRPDLVDDGLVNGLLFTFTDDTGADVSDGFTLAR